MAKATIQYLYSLPGSWNWYGPIEVRDEKEARMRIRKFWGLKTTRGVELEVTSREKEEQKSQEKKAFYADVLKANPHLCLADF